MSTTSPVVPPEVVRLALGDLDAPAVADLRTALREVTSVPGTRVEVDLSHVDDRHPLTLFALLSGAAQRGSAHGTVVAVRLPPPSMTKALTAVGVEILRTPVGPDAPVSVRRIGAGDAQTARAAHLAAEGTARHVGPDRP